MRALKGKGAYSLLKYFHADSYDPVYTVEQLALRSTSPEWLRVWHQDIRDITCILWINWLWYLIPSTFSKPWVSGRSSKDIDAWGHWVYITQTLSQRAFVSSRDSVLVWDKRNASHLYETIYCAMVSICFNTIFFFAQISEAGKNQEISLNRHAFKFTDIAFDCLSTCRSSRSWLWNWDMFSVIPWSGVLNFQGLPLK